MSDANIEIVKKGWECFFQGDMDAFVETLSPEIEWDHRGPSNVPFNRLYEGREDVIDFFSDIADSLEMLDFNPSKFLASKDTVVTLGSFRWRVRKTGKDFESDFAFVYTITGGVVTKWKPIYDKGAESAAFEA